ncbi:MAG TPA: response regulator [Firmicutes bacterium]|nr:response regulator [Bacillota bacterium]
MRKKAFFKALSKIRFNLVLLALFIALSVVSLHLLQGKLLENAQEIGGGMATAYAVEEERNITAYETLINLETQYMEQLLAGQPDAAAIQDWLDTFAGHAAASVDTGAIHPYAVIDGALYTPDPARYAGADPTGADWYQTALAAGGDIVFSDAYMDDRLGRLVVTIARQCGGDNVLAFDIFPEDFQVRANTQELPAGSSYYLCDAGGQVLYMDTSFTADREALETYTRGLVEKIQSGTFTDADAYVTDLEGKRRGVYYDVASNGWISIVTIPHRVLLEDFWNLSLWYMGFFFIFLMATAALSVREYRLGRRMERTNHTVRVLGNSYYAIYRVNYQKGTYDMIKGSDYIRARLPEQGDYDDFIRTAGGVIEPAAYEEFLTSFSIANIRELAAKRVRDYGGDFLRLFDGAYRWVNVRLLIDESLSPGEAVLCFRQIDAEKQRQLQQMRLLENALDTARKNEASQSSFFSSMSHDMRTPLNAIIGLTGLAGRHLEEPDRLADDLKKIEAAGKQLLGLINDILEMSRLQQGHLSLDNQKINLPACIEECTGVFQHQAQQEGKDYRVEIDVKDKTVYGDAFRLSQILNNLLSNAFKFTQPGDRVSVAVRQVENQAHAKYQITVTDTGAGMSEDFLDKIFIPYERETRFGAKNVSGTGLGMPIVKSIVSQMGGQITVESRLGQGSTFTLLLPLEAAGEETDADAPKGQKADYSLADKKILLAEDNEVNMDIAAEILELQGAKVTKAWNGREALEAFKASEPGYFDAVLMDMQMPEMNGCEAARAIRALPRPDAAKVPILAVTANAFAEDIAATAEAGMDAHISKPIDFTVLCRTLAGLTTEKE